MKYLNILNVRAPTKANTPEENDEFYAYVANILEKMPTYENCDRVF